MNQNKYETCGDILNFYVYAKHLGAIHPKNHSRVTLMNIERYINTLSSALITDLKLPLFAGL